MQRLFEFLCGLLFGIGLVVSGMTDPGKILGFLDVAGAWDPSLLLVMGGAVAVGLVALLVGSLVFGIGWGLAGFCPGPVLVAAGAGYPKAVAFTVAMLAGMALQRAWAARSPRA
jgi:uncharacterized membrane protein YedE/YeeE